MIFENCLSSNKQIDVACQAGHFLEEEGFSLNKESKMKQLETELEYKMKYLTIQTFDEKVCYKICYQYIQPRPNMGVDFTLVW